MTTQNTHHEHSDVDSSVVGHQPVPETMADSITSEDSPAEGAEAQALSSPSTEPDTSAKAQEETNQEASIVSTDDGNAIPAPETSGENQGVHNPEFHTFTTPTESTAQMVVEPAPVPPPVEETVSTRPETSEVRSFTDFIEEFRLAEEARLKSSRQEVAAESMALLIEEAGTMSSEQDEPQDKAESSIAAAGETLVKSDTSATEHSVAQAFATLRAEITEDAIPAPQEQKEAAPSATANTEPAVSPLLRPATRLRIPRHGGTRHHQHKETAPAESESAEQPAQAELSTQPAVSETAVESPTHKPARRYRFDRPAATANNTANTASNAGTTQSTPPTQTAQTQQRSEESKGKKVPASRVAESSSHNAIEQSTNEQVGDIQSKPTGNGLQQSDKQASDRETTGVAHTSSAESGRRRQTQDPQKEQTTATNATTPDTTPSVPEGAAQRVEPEDLPPLEYSELQKASTRRRRRHRSSSSNANSNNSTMPGAAEGSAPEIGQPAEASATQSPASQSQSAGGYSIISGYTIGQMNQGNGNGGPFMGPEPSPARGSVVSRDGRATRAESQRTPAYPTLRAGESGSSAASMNHFANVITQAIQAQTDRMVAEFRRQSQAPTNVSVSLPPFPSTERVGVFVDVANLLYSARTLRTAIDFGKLLDFLRGNRRLVRAHAYCPTSPQVGDEQMFLQAVKGLGYRITTKNYKTFSSGAKKADLDLDLCMDVVRLVEGKAVDCIVLVSGDSDFMPMLDYCSDHGVRVEVAAFDEAMSATLRQSCDLFVNLSMLEEIRA